MRSNLLTQDGTTYIDSGLYYKNMTIVNDDRK
jgi:hypothetical protein